MGGKASSRLPLAPPPVYLLNPASPSAILSFYWLSTTSLLRAAPAPRPCVPCAKPKKKNPTGR